MIEQQPISWEWPIPRWLCQWSRAVLYVTLVMTTVIYSSVKMRTIKASEFKPKCLKIMDEVAATGEPVEITKKVVPGLCQPAGPGLGGQAAVSAGELDLGQRPV